MKISRRIKASRANGARSDGPKTPEGKQRSHTHAISPSAWSWKAKTRTPSSSSWRIIETRFAPVGEAELGFIKEMAAAYWRMRRRWTIEAELLNTGMRRAPGVH
jgi:hypothetical protein